MIFDIEKEKQACRDWMNNSKGEMDTDAIIYLAAHGIDDCADYCTSREVSEDDACRCIRSVFPTPEHYHLYLNLRRQFIEWTKLAIAASATNKSVPRDLAQGEKNNEEEKSATSSDRHL